MFAKRLNSILNGKKSVRASRSWSFASFLSFYFRCLLKIDECS